PTTTTTPPPPRHHPGRHGGGIRTHSTGRPTQSASHTRPDPRPRSRTSVHRASPKAAGHRLGEPVSFTHTAATALPPPRHNPGRHGSGSRTHPSGRPAHPS